MIRCSECHGPATPCESCPHGEGDVLCANPESDHYGEHVAPLARIGCTCPDDCNCHQPWRTNFCGCRQH